MGVSCVHLTPESDERGRRRGYKVHPNRVTTLFGRTRALHYPPSVPNTGSLYLLSRGT